MTINLTMPTRENALKPRIMVIGVGGAGGNAVNNMIESKLEGVEFLASNTDAQALVQSLAERKIQLGENITHGLGAGSKPEIGRAAAEEAIDEIADHLAGTHMVFIAAGMGGGTGTGAAPVIARLAREHEILTVGVVTRPFNFEGMQRARIAEAGIQEIQQYVDTLIVIPNQNLFGLANEKTTFSDAFAMADQVLYSGVRGITDLIVVPGRVNLDFSDIRTVMSEMGKAMMGTGEAEGEGRATRAAEAAISNPLLDDMSMNGAREVLINITGGDDMTLFEVEEAADRIRKEVDETANIIFGSAFDPALEGGMRVSVVATGIDSEGAVHAKPVLKVVTDREAGAAHWPHVAGPEAAAAYAPAVPAPGAAEDAEPGAALPPASADLPDLGPAPACAEAGRKTEACSAARRAPEPEAVREPDPVSEPVPKPEPLPVSEPEPAAGGQAQNEPAPERGPEDEAQERKAPRLFGGWPGRRQRETAGREAVEPPPLRRAGPAFAPAADALAGQPEKPAAKEPMRTMFDTSPPPRPEAAAEDEADLLEIPAFLRRQAN